MDHIMLRFTYKWPYNVASWLVARAGGSKHFSHVMAVIDGYAYEATMLEGCRIVPLDVAMKGVKSYVDMMVPVPDIAASIEWGKEQQGKPYDFAGAFGLPLLMSDSWSDDDKWWCSEHNFTMIGAGGLWMLDKTEHSRITPDDLYKCNYSKSGFMKV